MGRTSNTAFGLTFDRPRGHVWPDGYLKSAFHPWIELSPLQNDLTPLVSRLITGLIQVVEQRRTWTLIVQVVKRLCDLFSWGWMSSGLMMRNADGNCLSACLMQVEIPKMLQALMLIQWVQLFYCFMQKSLIPCQAFPLICTLPWTPLSSIYYILHFVSTHSCHFCMNYPKLSCQFILI